MAKYLIIGCGDVGTALGNQWAVSGHTVVGMKRRPPEEQGAFAYITGDIGDSGSLAKLDGDFDLAVFVVAADSRDEQSYRLIYELGLDNVLRRFPNVPLIFVSSTSVYGQLKGEWVDEDSDACSESFNGRLIRSAEERVLMANPANVIVRFAGIYGPGRTYMVRQAASGAAVQADPPYYTNRIHRDDCVGVLALLSQKLLAGASLARCYLASDNDPAPLWDVVSWLAERQQCPIPPKKPTAADAPMNKRCRNERLTALGYRFLYPTFREGYQWVGA